MAAVSENNHLSIKNSPNCFQAGGDVNNSQINLVTINNSCTGIPTRRQLEGRQSFEKLDYLRSELFSPWQLSEKESFENRIYELLSDILSNQYRTIHEKNSLITRRDPNLIAYLNPWTTVSVCVKIREKSDLRINRKGENYVFIYMEDITGGIVGIALNTTAMFVYENMAIGEIYIIRNIDIVPMSDRHRSICNPNLKFKSFLNESTVINKMPSAPNPVAYKVDSNFSDFATQAMFKPMRLFARVLDMHRVTYPGCHNPNCTHTIIRVRTNKYICAICKREYTRPKARFRLYLKLEDLKINSIMVAFCSDIVAGRLLDKQFETYDFTCLQKVKGGQVKYTMITNANLCRFNLV